MGARRKWKVDLLSGRSAALVVLSGLFLLGSAAGCIAAGLVRDDDGALLSYINGWLASDAGGAFWPLLWETVRIPLVVLLLGFTPIGVAGIPAVFAVRGFLLCYAVSVFYRMLGFGGLLAAFVLFGLSALFWLPALLQLGTRGMLGSYGMFRRAAGEGRYPLCYNGSYLLSCAACVGLLGLGAMVEYWSVPTLLQMISGIFSPV